MPIAEKNSFFVRSNVIQILEAPYSSAEGKPLADSRSLQPIRRNTSLFLVIPVLFIKELFESLSVRGAQ